MRFPYVVLLSACALTLALPLLAQSPNGVINGLVADPSNRVIVGSEVVVVNDVTGEKYTTKTNAEGIYVLPNLPPGPYRLQVSKLGFKTIIKPDITLNVQDALSINFTLPIGASYETVTVEGGASMINTTDASVSTVIDHTYVENMPLNGRSFQDLILLTPGVVTQTPQISLTVGGGLGQTGEFSVNGQRTEANYYTVDGVSANVGAAPGSAMIAGGGASGTVAAATALGTTQALVSVDDLQEFRVNSSTYSAEYGRSPGGQFAFETKSGTNQWHGTAYDYLRNGYFDAQDWFNDYFGKQEPGLRQNDFGGTLGGPVEIPGLYHGKDRTFFFVSYEGLRLTAPYAATSSYVPDATLRTSTRAPLNQVLDAFPLQNGPDDATNGVAQFVGTWSNPSSLNSASVRFDHVINERLRLFFRFSDTSSNSSSRGSGGTPSTDSTSTYKLRTYTAGANSVLTNHLSNEFRLNYSSNEVTSISVIDELGGNTPVDLARLAGLGPSSTTTVEFLVGPYFLELSQQQASGAQKQWNLTDTVSFSSGRHQFKFGVDYRRLAPFEAPVNPFVAYIYSGESSIESNNGYIFPTANAAAYPLYTNLSAFAQDDWKISQRLSLSLGLRWDLNPAPGVTRGLKAYTVDLVNSNPSAWALAPQGTPLWQTTWFNFAPRVGAAYLLRNTPGWETVARGGGGVFFDTGQQLGSLSFAGPGFGASGSFLPQSFPCSPAPPATQCSVAALIPRIVNPPTGPFTTVYGFAPHLQLPYTLQWNASVEQALGKSQAITVSYVASHASRLLQQNKFVTSTNPLTGTFFIAQNGLTSDYDSLQFQFRKRLSTGLTALASYTWSHCLDYNSVNFVSGQLGYQRGNCDFDVRHNLAAAFSYDLPNFGSNSFVNAVLHHWGLDDRFTARTAFPVSLTGNSFLDPTTDQVESAGMDLVQGQPIYLYGAHCTSVYIELYSNTLPCPGGRAINPCAFVTAGTVPVTPCTTYGLDGPVGGLAPRNFARGFGAWQMDLAVRRDFPIHERLKLQFRAEAFNIFNHPNLGAINTSLGLNTFGQATATLANSLGVLSPLYQQGGNRSMQFALKLIF
jgi:hypothetical protein